MAERQPEHIPEILDVSILPGSMSEERFDAEIELLKGEDVRAQTKSDLGDPVGRMTKQEFDDKDEESYFAKRDAEIALNRIKRKEKLRATLGRLGLFRK